MAEMRDGMAGRKQEQATERNGRAHREKNDVSFSSRRRGLNSRQRRQTNHATRRRSERNNNIVVLMMYTSLAAYLSVASFNNSLLPSMIFGSSKKQQPKRADLSRRRKAARESRYSAQPDERAENFFRTGNRNPKNQSVKKGNKIAEKERVNKEELPPITSILVNGKIKPNADTSALLDYAVIGFAKTGTTSLHRHLASAHTLALSGEHCDLVVNDTAKLVEEIYEDYRQRMAKSKDGIVEKKIRGLKCPQDVQSSLHNYARYFNKTKLIIGIRHPLFWFESLYNYRVSNVPWKDMPPTSKLTGGCPAGSQGECGCSQVFIWSSISRTFLVLRFAVDI